MATRESLKLKIYDEVEKEANRNALGTKVLHTFINLSKSEIEVYSHFNGNEFDNRFTFEYVEILGRLYITYREDGETKQETEEKESDNDGKLVNNYECIYTVDNKVNKCILVLDKDICNQLVLNIFYAHLSTLIVGKGQIISIARQGCSYCDYLYLNGKLLF